ncbi:hypothetical protein G4H71_15790 [Rhodococcus triatomae]|uniref:Uncharacterized protein n=1 Tax=Rhodococcus triatomae TaxID=300028 RepID=A0A1G8J914_9NOCA|nr:hypothetical protein [Rhodococcus triatomae]QNG19783.1 hypothetical protein G4H72_14580 [Rhodococcus triatomae]QNG24301.1 hypothetical protein G4H71_15790 [Rhodococcus triatomae]SDI27553.1 hypothetical protein SAMN05444695_106108 [Rhodococcus triatomae]
MKNRIVARAVAALGATVGLTAAGVMAAAPANAQEPFNLRVEGGVHCSFGQPGQPWQNFWSMHRWMDVVNDGPGVAPNVVLQEFGGAHKFAQELKPGERLTIDTRWFGCWPSSISGYTYSSLIDPLQDNVGFWANVELRENPLPEGAPVPPAAG